MSLPITIPQDLAPDSPMARVINLAMRAPTVLSAAPTTAGKQLPLHGDWGVYTTNLYFNLDGSVYRFAGTLV